MSISQFLTSIDEISVYIDKLHQKSFSADFNGYDYAREVNHLEDLFNDISKVNTKDEVGNALTDEDGKKMYNASDLLELDRIEHIYDIVKQKLNLLNKLSSSNDVENVKEQIHSAYSALQAKEAFFAGKGNVLEQRLDSTESSESVALVYGPLNKNIYTEQYEELVKGMVRGLAFKLVKDPQTNEYFIKMNGQEFNLTQILKFANLTHLSLNQQDCDSYLKMMAT